VTADLDTARERLRELRAQADRQRHDGITGGPHNRKAGADRVDRQSKNRRGRRRVAQRIRSG